MQKVLQYLFEHKETTPDEQACLTAFAKAVPDVHAQGRAIPVARMSLTYEKKHRLMLHNGNRAHELGVQKIIEHAMLREGAESKEGEAPQNNIDRQVREFFQIGNEYTGAV